LTGPGFWQTDASIQKNFSYKEKAAIQFRADIFNLFNMVNLALPDGCVDCVGAGAAFVSTGDRRSLQFAIRLEF
jgi:hypothetical protein